MNKNKSGGMKPEERAKQFLPFASLKGLDEKLKEAEKTFTEKRELLDDEIESLNRRLAEIETGSVIEAEYYALGRYVKITGRVEKIDYTYRRIQVDGKTIMTDNIVSLKTKLHYG